MKTLSNNIKDELISKLTTIKSDGSLHQTKEILKLYDVLIDQEEDHNHVVEVFCKIQAEGIHFWENCDIPEVNYLIYPHRHVFFITAYAEVSHDDRDIEFIKLKHQIEQYLSETYWNYNIRLHDFGGMSCEMIGQELLDYFNLTKIEISEDNENGMIITRK